MKLIILLTLLFSIGCQEKTLSPSNKLIKSTHVTLGSECPKVPVGNPQSITELMTHINSLPMPLELECFIRSLARPLYVNATSSEMSAQPADGKSSPRIFIFKGDLIISLVPSGEGSKILEFSELRSGNRSIKGEITLPVYDKVMPAQPFIRISTVDKTSCSGCHSDERFEKFVDGAKVYSSEALRPGDSKNVDIDFLENENAICSFYQNPPQRCRVFSALFSGEVVPRRFPSGMNTFINAF